MRRTPADRDRHRGAVQTRTVIAAASALLGAVLLAAGLLSEPAPPAAVVAPARVTASPTETPTPAPTDTPERDRRPAPAARAPVDLRDRITGSVLAESEPVSLAIPDLDVRTRLVDLGLDSRGELEVPQDPARAGWFSRGAAPGALGPAVVAGHVTWDGVPAVFHRLGTLRRGAHVWVTRADGRTVLFTVTRVAQFSKSAFPTEAVYGPVDHAGLRLITCGGTYDTARHRYLDNVVVFARLSAVRDR